jgi:hypothetical protein
MNTYEAGFYWENEVEKVLRKWGYKTEKYVTLNDKGDEIAQVWVYQNKKYAHPDFKIFNENGNLVMYVEVKSFGNFYRNRGYAPKLSGFKNYVYVKKYNFESYLKLMYSTEYNTRIVFIIEPFLNRKEQWFRGDVSELDETKIEVTNPFGAQSQDDDYFYFWDIKDLKEIKNISR